MGVYVEIELIERGWGGVDWIKLARNGKILAVVSMAMSLRVI
jgi:hypothetical protein